MINELNSVPSVARVGLVFVAGIVLGTEPRRACEVIPMSVRGEEASSSYGSEPPDSSTDD